MFMESNTVARIVYIQYKQSPPRVAALHVLNGIIYATTVVQDFESGLSRMVTIDVYKSLDDRSLRFCHPGK